MKKFKGFVFLLAIVFVLPLFCFSCGEVTFDDIKYVFTDLTTSEIVDNVDYAKSQAILNEIKMDLQTEITFTFHKTSDERFADIVFKKQISSQIGKDRDALIYSRNEKKFKGNHLYNEVQDIYEKKTENYQTTAYCYKVEDTYGESASTKYSRSNFDYSVTSTLNNFYSSIISDMDYKEFDMVYTKTFDGVNYYKLVADIDGLGNVKNKFSVKNLSNRNKDVEVVENEPDMFVKDQNLDFVQNFSCEFGLKDASGTLYLTYFKVDYSVTNVRFEKYLEVSAKTDLLRYGDGVSVKDVDDRGLHVASTFVDKMNSNNSYCVFNSIEDNVVGKATYTVLKLEKSVIKQVEGQEDEEISYFDYAIKKTEEELVDKGEGMQSLEMVDRYYYVEGYLNGANIAYKTYERTVNGETVSWNEINDFAFDFKDFDFSVCYDSKEDVEESNVTLSSYSFKKDNNTLKVVINQANDVSRIEGNFQSKVTKINVLTYGIDNENRIGVIVKQ